MIPVPELKTALLFVLVLVFSVTQAQDVKMNLPAAEPESQGISSDTLNQMLQFLRNTRQNIHHLSIIRNKHLVVDTDFYPYSSNNLHDVASVTKSITSLLIGIAIDNGFIKNEFQPVLPFFPEITTKNNTPGTLSIQHLLTMTSGFDCSVADGEKALTGMRKSDDWVRYIFDLPVVSPPGKNFSYCSCNYYLLGEILFRATKLTPHAFAKKHLFEPLQIKDSKWLGNYKGIEHGWGDLYLLPKDMIKIGQLVADSGHWQNKKIISAQWIAKSFRTFTKLPDGKGYGYGWWTNEQGGFIEAAGRGRQTISVIPAKNVVVTMLGGEFDAGAIGGYIFSSIRSDKTLPINESGYEKFQESLKLVRSEPADSVVPIRDSMFRIFQDNMILLSKNILDIDSIRFHFNTTNQLVSLFRLNKEEKYPFAISSSSYELSDNASVNLPVALQAYTEGDTFVLHYNQLCSINNFYFRFKLKGENISLSIEETTNGFKSSVPVSIQNQSK